MKGFSLASAGRVETSDRVGCTAIRLVFRLFLPAFVQSGGQNHPHQNQNDEDSHCEHQFY